MGFADDKFMEYLRKNLTRLEIIRIDELLLSLAGCLSMTTVEKLNVYVRNSGNRHSVLSFYLDLSRCDDWVTHFIFALRECGHNKLAQEFEEVYSSYQLPPRQSAPPSLPPSVIDYNQQPTQEKTQRISSPPGQMPSASLDTQPGSSTKHSQSFNRIQPELEMSRSSPSQENHEFRSLPPFRPGPPSHRLSAPTHLSKSGLEEDKSRNPVPESTPYQPAPSEDDGNASETDESSILENPHIVPDPLPSHSLSPSIKQPESEVSIPPSSEDVSLEKVLETRTTPSYSHSVSSEGRADNWRGQSVRNKTEKLPEQEPAYMTVTPGQKDHGGNGQQREQSVNHKVEDFPDSRPVRSRSANRELAQKEPIRERPGNQQVVSGSSCRPLDNNNHYDEDCVSKPGVLVSTLGFAASTIACEESSVMSHIPELEISDSTERNESSHVSGRSSPTSITQDDVPAASTPNSRNTQIKDRKSPEENDYSFDLKSSPRHRPLGHSSSKQPEQNTFGSTDVRHHKLHFNETSEEDLIEGNADAFRNRPEKIPSTSEPNYSKKTEGEGRDRERTVLIAITVASLCLSLYLMWKLRQN